MINNAYPNTKACYTQEGANCTKCKHVVWFGKQAYCGYCPARCGPHQVIKSKCIWCKHYTLSLTAKMCVDCLSSDSRINFERQEEKDIARGIKEIQEGKDYISNYCPGCGKKMKGEKNEQHD